MAVPLAKSINEEKTFSLDKRIRGFGSSLTILSHDRESKRFQLRVNRILNDYISCDL